MTIAIDPSDIPTVAVRELVLALKLLTSGRGALIPAHGPSELDIRRVEQAYWQVSRRDCRRKTAVLLRFRSLLEACEAPRLKAVMSSHGEVAVVPALAAAARMRLNAKWGFNPHKIARAIREAVSAIEPPASLPGTHTAAARA